MPVIGLASETDFEGWRAAARRLRKTAVPPDAVAWAVTPDEVLLGAEFQQNPLETPREKAAGYRRKAGEIRVSRGFLEIARAVVLHRSPERFALLYRLLWRLETEPGLLHAHGDSDVARARDMARAVFAAVQGMKAFVRFRRLEGIRPETYAAWFEPPHRVLERVAPFFVERFAGLRFSILTPDATLTWDTETAVFGPGADVSGGVEDDALEDIWLTYRATTFSPARLKAVTVGMSSGAGRRNPSGASLIPEPTASAPARTLPMIDQAPSQPSLRARKAAMKLARDGSYDDVPQGLEEVVAGIQICRRCDLWRHATQGVPGEGAARATLMFVGEQPGDQEDLAGKPFVGPAGQLFDRALETAGVPRERTYVTNAVKHFKHEPRGKRRIHQTPTAGEVRACRWWLDSERRLVRPRVIVALGATAALAVFGKPMPIGANRGRKFQLPDQTHAVVTWHPSYLLRVPDEATRARAWAAFVDDLKMAWEAAG